jgi:hypothetical protein
MLAVESTEKTFTSVNYSTFYFTIARRNNAFRQQAPHAVFADIVRLIRLSA